MLFGEMALCNSIQTVPIEKKRCKPCLNEGICFFKIDSNQMNSNLHDWNTWNWKLKCINHQFAHLTFYCCGKEKYILGRLTWLWHKITCCGRTNFSKVLDYSSKISSNLINQTIAPIVVLLFLREGSWIKLEVKFVTITEGWVSG